MRICLVASSFIPMVGGAEIAVHNLAVAMTSLGHRVTVVAPGYSRPLRGRLVYELWTVPPGTLPLMARSETLGERYLRAGFALLRRKKFDVVNLHFVLPLGPALVKHRPLGDAPLFITFHGADVQVDASIGYGLRLNKALEPRIRAAINGADGLVAVSQSVRDSLEEVVEGPRRVFTIPNGVDLQRFHSVVPQGRFRARLGVPHDVPLLLAVGRNHIKKGFRYLVEAMPEVLAAHPEARCAIVGRGVGELSGEVTARGVTDRVWLVDEIGAPAGGAGLTAFPADGIIEAYKESDILVSPSLIEGCSLAVIEGLAGNLPVVAADAPGNRDAVVDGHNGLLCRPCDAHDLAAKVSRLLGDAALRRRLGENAGASVREYDWVAIARRYLAAYEEMRRDTTA